MKTYAPAGEQCGTFGSPKTGKIRTYRDKSILPHYEYGIGFPVRITRQYAAFKLRSWIARGGVVKS